MRIASNGTISLGAAPGAESLRVTPVASAVNFVNLFGNVASSSPFLLMSGSDTNIALALATKGTGNFGFFTGAGSGLAGAVQQFNITHTASAVNYLQVTGGAASSAPVISAQGSDTNIKMQFLSKGTGDGTYHYDFLTSSFTRVFAVHSVASSVNRVEVSPSATGNAVQVLAAGSDTNIDLALTPKGTGNVRFGTHTGTADVAITGYIEVKDSAGNVRKLAVIT
jgi:hypothetical protein